VKQLSEFSLFLAMCSSMHPAWAVVAILAIVIIDRAADIIRAIREDPTRPSKKGK
jgi:hypothetical protein